MQGTLRRVVRRAIGGANAPVAQTSSELTSRPVNEFDLGMIAGARRGGTDSQSWQAHLPDELRFWDRYFSTRGANWPQEFAERINPASTLTEMEIVRRIPRGRADPVRILDVGAGPLTILGKTLPGVRLEITAVDPLAHDYNAMLDHYGIVPPLRTIWCEGEQLAEQFRHDRYDFAYA